jgi:hypothetical protein
MKEASSYCVSVSLIGDLPDEDVARLEIVYMTMEIV